MCEDEINGLILLGRRDGDFYSPCRKIMEYIKVGESGLKITEITFGTALTIGTESDSVEYGQSLLDMAWKLGIRSFDTSNNYGYGEAERLLGKCLKKYPRHEYVLATKGAWPVGDGVYERGLSRKHILWALEESLKKLEVEYVDLYYAHRYDADVPMSEIVRTFNGLINDGKIRYWATSEWPLEALEECVSYCEKNGYEKPVCEQFIYSYAVRKAEKNGVKEFCDRNGIGTLGFSPLCQGFLTGKYKNSVPEDSRIAKSDKLDYHKTINFYTQNKQSIDYFLCICEKNQVEPVAVALQWCLRRRIYPVLGASKSEQLEKNIKCLEQKIPENVWEALEGITEGEGK